MRNSLDEGSFLEAATLQYWNLSLAVNNRCDTSMTVSDAMHTAREALGNLKPSRLVAKCYTRILHGLIKFGAGDPALDAELDALMDQDNQLQS